MIDQTTTRRQLIRLLGADLAALAGLTVPTSTLHAWQRQRRSLRRTTPSARHARSLRNVMLAAWARLKDVSIPGLASDQRFEIKGDEYYVSPDGDDASSGSKYSPWRTLRHAVSQLRPGTVIWLAPGTYYGLVTIETRANEEEPAAIRALKPGTVVVRYPKDFVTRAKADVVRSNGRPIDEKGRAIYGPLITVRGTYVEISGLHLIGARDELPPCIYSQNGVSFSNGGGEGCRVLYNEIERMGHCGVKERGHGGHHIQIEGNYIHDIGHTHLDHCIYMPADDGLARRNLLTTSTGYGLNAYSRPARFVATHNVLIGNRHFGMLQAGPDALIAHNVFMGNRRGGLSFYRAGCKNCRVVNNIFFDSPAVDFDCFGARKAYPSGNVLDHNCFVPWSKFGRMSPQDRVGRHNFRADPLLADVRRFNFRPLRRSPCLDAGTPIGLEYCGRAPDVGLYEVR